ncbi:MAG: DUF502 domain-containing protein [Elusimicrobia bacterium]|nr:DUF502 domain-containing protein [Elusimicrobiota bacterium]
MKNFVDFIRITLKGGIWFLFPFVVLWIVVGKAQDITIQFVAPLAERIPVHTLLGIGLIRVLALVIIVLACFAAGLFSKTKPAQKIVFWLESHFLSKLPGYEFLKTTGGQFLHVDQEGQQNVVLARIEDAWQIGYITEALENDLFAIYIPGAPVPSSGSLYFMTEDRFARLKLTIPQAQQCLRRLGHGSKTLLPGQKGVNRT